MKQSKLNQIPSEFSDISSSALEDLDSIRLVGELEGCNCLSSFIASQGLEKKADARLNCSTHEEDQRNFLCADGDCKFKILELSHQLEKNKKSMQDLYFIYKRFVKKIEDALTGVEVIKFEGNCIILFLRICVPEFVPNLERILVQQKIEDITHPSAQIFNLSVEVEEGTMEIKNAKIIPNEIYIRECIDAAKSSRQLLSPQPPLECFVRRVQHKIVLCMLRKFIVRLANKSRHLFEYLNRDEIIVVHMGVLVDAFIKTSQGWPVSGSALKLITLKSACPHSKDFSLSFLCKVEEVANSWGEDIRQILSTFVDAIEEMLIKHSHAKC